MRRYKKFICVNCGYSWVGWTQTPKCPKCKKKRIEDEEVTIPQYEPKKEIAQKIITDIEKYKNVEKIEENIETPEIMVENEEEEEIIYFCSDCKSKIQKGDLYCDGCGGALHWEDLEDGISN